MEDLKTAIKEEHIRQASVSKVEKFADELLFVALEHTRTTATHLNDIEKIMAITFLGNKIIDKNKDTLGEDVLKMIEDAVKENEERKEIKDGNKSC